MSDEKEESTANATSTIDDFEKTVRDVIDSIRPTMQSEGGDIEFISVDEQKCVHVRMVGACGNCPMASMELKSGVEQYLKEICPGVKEIIQEM